MADFSPQKLEPILKNVTLKDVQDNVLGDHDSAQITREFALKIFAVTSNQHTFFIQTRSIIDDSELEHPILWKFHQWSISAEKQRRARLYQDRERDRRLIEAANIRVLSRCIRKKMLLREEQSDALARQALATNNHLAFQFYGLTKLITKVDEI